MSRLLSLAALTAMAVLAFAPAALAQSFRDLNAQVGDTCPPGLAAFGDPSSGLTCLSQQDLAELEAGTLSRSEIPVADASPAAAEQPSATQQYAAPESPTAPATAAVLPDTGGLPLPLLAGAALLGAGLLIRKR